MDTNYDNMREKECVLTGALTMAALMSHSSPVDKAVIARCFKSLQDVLEVSAEQVRGTVRPESETLKEFVHRYIQNPDVSMFC